MKDKLQKEKWMISRNIILETLRNYELGDAYLIIKGLDILGYDNIDFWFQLVEIIKKYKGLDYLPFYINIMEELGNKKLNFYMNEFKNKYTDFQDIYIEFIGLLSETKKLRENIMANKK